MKRRIPLSISLRNRALLSALVGTVSASAWADPPAKPAAPPAAAPAAKAAAPATKTAAPAAKAPEPAAKVAAPAAPKPRPKAVVAPPKVAAAVVPLTAAPAAKEDDVAALRAEANTLREDMLGLRAELNHALGTSAVNANHQRAQLEVELAEARKKRASIQAAIDAGLDSAAVADSITSSDARIAQLDFALRKRAETSPSRSLAEISADVQRLDAAVAKEKSAAPTGEPDAAQASA